MSYWQLFAVALCGLHFSSARRAHLSFVHTLSSSDAENADIALSAEEHLQIMVSDMLLDNAPTGSSSLLDTGAKDSLSMSHITHVTEGRMDLSDAVQRLNGKLPAEVASLVRLSSDSSSNTQGFSEASLQKARRILNTMIYKSWNELDAEIIACKEFCLRNRRTYEQVVNDIARLGSQIANLERQRSEANQEIADMDSERKQLDASLEKETHDYRVIYYRNHNELTLRQSDLAVFDFILNLTACKGDATEFLQLGADSTGKEPLRICRTKDGLELDMNDPKMQEKLQQMMTPSAKEALSEALGDDDGLTGFLQISGQATTSFNTTTVAALTFATPTVPANQEPIPTMNWKKCTDGKPNCGLLHDTMSMQWGKFKDLVDELQAEMDKSQDEFEKLQDDMNEQLSAIRTAKAESNAKLGEAISSLNADNEAKSGKLDQETDLRHEYDRTMQGFKSRITEIMYTDICAVRKVRNSVMRFSSVSKAKDIVDCDMGDWLPGECSMACDDNCPQSDPYACGGWQSLKREANIAPNQYGIQCPPLTNKKKCNQLKCPVNCEMSRWSGFSGCTKDCEGGVQARTRSIITKPKNGGRGCDTVQEEQTCNTGSCDRDCKLDLWTDWSPCSMACGGGLQTRHKTVNRPIRGRGKCYKAESNFRFGQKVCNPQDCQGDEICIGKQDLIILLDGSGSLKLEGFNVLRDFAANLTDRYLPEYYGLQDMRVGAILFGNGHLQSDGTITPAINVQPITANMAETKTRILETTWQKGFTNMAQAFALADTMLGQITEGDRDDAQSAVLVLTDGKPSFKFATAQKAAVLHDKNVQMFIAAVTDVKGDELHFLKHTLASQPWDTNFVRVPGLEALKRNQDLFTGQIIAKFCPDSISPTLIRLMDESRKYMLIHEGGFPSNECGKWYWIGRVANIDECAEAARAKHQSAFSLGKGRYRAKYCYSEAIQVTTSKWYDWLQNRTGPACPGGRWLNNPYYDVYAIKPST